MIIDKREDPNEIGGRGGGRIFRLSVELPEKLKNVINGGGGQFFVAPMFSPVQVNNKKLFP